MTDTDVGIGDVKLTPEMIRAGLQAFRRWRPDEEDEAALIAAVFYSMIEARTERVSGGRPLHE